MTVNSLAARLVRSSFRTRVAELNNPDQLPARALRTDEISALQSGGNSSSDWTRVLVSEEFDPSAIRDCEFHGDCRLGSFDGKLHTYQTPGGSIPLVRGLSRTSFIDTWIQDGAAVHRCPIVQGARIAKGAAIQNSSLRYTKSKPCGYGNGTRIPIGVEIGGRDISIFADLSLELAQFVLDRPADPKVQKDFADLLADYCRPIQCAATIVDSDAVILDAAVISDSYIGANAYIHQSSCIEDSTIISTPADPTEIGPGSVVRTSIVQEGVKIDSGALVLRSMLFEHSYATEHGKVQDCIVGPNSGVSLGEATASFMGPFVGFHHQSLLIANYWPGGRGNIGYGANVGSNHTSRMPDQECWPGEGMFFGLSTVIKYPANFRHAPYSIVAAGVTTLPQKMACPFSLINEPVAYYLEVPPGFNNLIPAWGLTENLYSLKRNEGKYKARNKAKRNSFDLELFRPEILQYMRDAIHALKDIPERKTIYLPSDVPAIGKNMMTDENRLKAIAAYEFFLELTEYRHLRDRILNEPKKLRSGEEIAQGQKRLERYLAMVPDVLARTIHSRERDFARGSRIIDDYPDTHVAVESDPFVVQTRQEVEDEIRSTKRALEMLCG